MSGTERHLHFSVIVKDYDNWPEEDQKHAEFYGEDWMIDGLFAALTAAGETYIKEHQGVFVSREVI